MKFVDDKYYLIPMFASGHGRTVEKLMQSLTSTSDGWKRVESALMKGNAFMLLKQICNLHMFKYNR